MTTSPSIAQPEIQAELISEALSSASVGFLVWDEGRRYVAANAAACELLGTTLDRLLGHRVGGNTVEGFDAVDGGWPPASPRAPRSSGGSTVGGRSRSST
jgi:PAS domain-containing protein